MVCQPVAIHRVCLLSAPIRREPDSLEEPTNLAVATFLLPTHGFCHFAASCIGRQTSATVCVPSGNISPQKKGSASVRQIEVEASLLTYLPLSSEDVVLSDPAVRSHGV